MRTRAILRLCSILVVLLHAKAGICVPRAVIVPEEPVPGELFSVSLAGLDADGAVAIRFGERAFPLWANGDGVWQGLVAVDRDQQPGVFELTAVSGPGEARRRTRVGEVRVRQKEYPEQRLQVTEGMVTLSPEDQARAARESRLIRGVLEERSATRLWHAPVVVPVDGPVSGAFGVRRFYNGKRRGYHSGLDLAAARGEPVRCAARGRVALTGDFFYTGNTVIVDHGLGLLTAYFHLDEVLVAEGQLVGAGETLGRVGSTGRSTGPHLHWGVYLAGVKTNPLSWVRLSGRAGERGETP